MAATSFSQALYSLGYQLTRTEVRFQDCRDCAGLPWELWRQLRLWPGPISTRVCPQSPQLLKLDSSQWWELLLIQVFGRGWVYKAGRGGGEVDGYRPQVPTAHSREERVLPSLLSCTGSGAQLWFQLHPACGPSARVCSWGCAGAHIGVGLGPQAGTPACSGQSPSEHPRRLGRARGEIGNGGRDFFHKHARLWSPLPVPSGCLFAADHSPLPDPGFQHPASIHTSTHDSDSGWEAQGWHRPSMQVLLCPAWLLRSPLSPWSSPLSQLIFPPGRGVVPQTQEPLLQLPHKGAGPFPFPLCFLLSFLVAWGFYLFSVCGPLLVFSTRSVVRTVPFPMYLCREVNSTCSCCAIVTPHPSYLSFFLLNRGGRIVWCSLPSKTEEEEVSIFSMGGQLVL